MAAPANSVAVATGSLVVTGTLTSFVAAENDVFIARGAAVPIARRDGPNQITLKQPWPLASLEGEAAWSILSLGEYWRSAISLNRRFVELLQKWEVVSPFRFDEAGPLSGRAAYNDQPKGFVYVAVDQTPIRIFIKLANTNSESDWSLAIYLGSGGQVEFGEALAQERQQREAAVSAVAGQISAVGGQVTTARGDYANLVDRFVVGENRSKALEDQVSPARGDYAQLVDRFVAGENRQTALSNGLGDAVSQIGDLQADIGSLLPYLIPTHQYVGGALPYLLDGRQMGASVPANQSGAGTVLVFGLPVSQAVRGNLVLRRVRLTLVFQHGPNYFGTLTPNLVVSGANGASIQAALEKVTQEDNALNQRVILAEAVIPNVAGGLAGLTFTVVLGAGNAGAVLILTEAQISVMGSALPYLTRGTENARAAFQRAIESATPDLGALLDDMVQYPQVLNGAAFRRDAKNRILGVTIPAGQTGSGSLVSQLLPMADDERGPLLGAQIAAEFDIETTPGFAPDWTANFDAGGFALVMSRNIATSATRRSVVFEGTFAGATGALRLLLQGNVAATVPSDSFWLIRNVTIRVLSTGRAVSPAQVAQQVATLRLAAKANAVGFMAAGDPQEAAGYGQTRRITDTSTSLSAAVAAFDPPSQISRAALSLGAGTFNVPRVLMRDYADLIGDHRDISTIIGSLSDNAADGDVIGFSTIEAFYDCRISGLTIVRINGRYVVHLDNPERPASLRKVISDCRLIHRGNATTAWAVINQNAAGCGINSGELLTFLRTYFEAPGCGIGIHNIGGQSKPGKVKIHHCEVVSRTSGVAIELSNLGSGRNDICEIVGTNTNGILRIIAQLWMPDDPRYQPANHMEWEVHGHGNGAMPVEVVDFGRALKVQSASASNTSAIALSGTAANALLGIKTTLMPGSGGIPGYAYGYADVSGASAGTSLGARLGDCRTTAKTLIVQIDGGSSTTVTFNQDHTAQSNATVLGIINAALGSAATASLYAVGERYRPRFTDEEKRLFNASSTGIRMGQACAYGPDEKSVRLMTATDPVSLFAGLAWEDIYPNGYGRVKTKGALLKGEFLGLTDAIALGTTIGIGATPGSWTTNPAIPLMRGSSTAAIRFLAGNEVAADGPMRSFATTIGSTGGTLTSAGALLQYRYVSEKLIYLRVEISTANIGSAVGALTFTAPAALAGGIMAGRETQVSGAQIQGYVTANSNVVRLSRYDGAFPAANGSYIIATGTLEVA